jgi:hypothetical protein
MQRHRRKLKQLNVSVHAKMMLVMSEEEENSCKVVSMGRP